MVNKKILELVQEKDLIDFLSDEEPEKIAEVSNALDYLQKTMIDIAKILFTKGSQYGIKGDLIKNEKYNLYGRYISGCIKQLDSIVEELKSNNEYVDVRNLQPHYIGEDFTHKKPSHFILDGVPNQVSSWRELARKTLRILINDPRFKITQFKKTSGRIRTTNRNMIDAYKLYSQRGQVFCVDLNLSSNDTVQFVGNILDTCNIEKKNYKIFLQ
ncbi:MAG: hypothetical protein ACOCP4_03400 [Candidatus Woesearchaeota archaeon]